MVSLNRKFPPDDLFGGSFFREPLNPGPAALAGPEVTTYDTSLPSFADAPHKPASLLRCYAASEDRPAGSGVPKTKYDMGCKGYTTFSQPNNKFYGL